MRTTLDLPEELIDEAREVLGFKSKTDTVVYALKEVIRRGHVRGLKDLFGKVHIELDMDKVRGRRAKS
jgi:Arc/MetJ family transcription regulator